MLATHKAVLRSAGAQLAIKPRHTQSQIRASLCEEIAAKLPDVFFGTQSICLSHGHSQLLFQFQAPSFLIHFDDLLIFGKFPECTLKHFVITDKWLSCGPTWIILELGKVMG